MLGSAIFEAAIGTVVIYILLSLLCLTINEWLARVFSLRAGVLRKEVRKLLGPHLAQAFETHPLIQSMFVRQVSGRQRFPDYIPPSTFALALMELAYDYTPGVQGHPGVTAVKTRWSDGDFTLLESLRLAATALSPIQTRLENWFSLAMEQSSGRFKRIANAIVLVLSAMIVGVANVDTLAIAGQLYENAANKFKAPVNFPLFWHGSHPGFEGICGLFVTWAAVSLGAPFWFDILNKLVNLRQTGLPPDNAQRKSV